MTDTALVAVAGLASLTVMGCLCYIVILAEQEIPSPFSRPWWRRMAG